MITGWEVRPLGELVGRVLDSGAPDRVAVVAVSGHSSSGKTTLASRLVNLLPDAAVLHTDDLAWNQGIFGWDALLLDEVLPRVRAGEALDWAPPAWVSHGRADTITLPGGLRFLLVEGVGANQAALRAAYDLVVWIETEEATRLSRDAVRVLEGHEMGWEDYLDWMARENAWVVAERPWERADMVVYGGQAVRYDRAHEVVLAAASSTGCAGAE